MSHKFEYDGCAQCALPKSNEIHTDSEIYILRRQNAILEAEKANLKLVINNLRDIVMPDVCEERNTALRENKKLSELVDQFRGSMLEETRAELYVKHIIPSAYGNDEYNMGGNQGPIAFIQYKKAVNNYPTIGNSWIEVAEKLAAGWRP